jgi:hypothetical protein
LTYPSKKWVEIGPALATMLGIFFFLQAALIPIEPSPTAKGDGGETFSPR